MSASTNPIAIIGAGPAGIAAALAFHAVGVPVKLYERYAEPKPAGNILNLWPPALKALREIGVDIVDIGAPCVTTFRNAKDKQRALVNLPQAVIDEYGGGFIGMIRPDLYDRMLAALPAGILVGDRTVIGLEDEGDEVIVRFDDETSTTSPVVIGTDGINSTVRELLWGEAPIREHDLHVIGGYTFDVPPGVSPREAVLRHSRTVQSSHTGIRSHGRDGVEWWFVERWNHSVPPPADLKGRALNLAKEFPAEVSKLIGNTDDDHVFRWPIRDRGDVPKVWSKGRISLAGDAIHATSPYAAYGAGMSIVDGYFLGQIFADVDLSDRAAVVAALEKYDGLRAGHTGEQVKLAYMLGRIFHRIPPFMRPIRDAFFDHSKFLQKMIGDANPAEIAAQLDVMGTDLRTPQVLPQHTP